MLIYTRIYVTFAENEDHCMVLIWLHVTFLKHLELVLFLFYCQSTSGKHSICLTATVFVEYPLSEHISYAHSED